MTKLERVTGFTLLTAFLCTLQVGIFDHIYGRVAGVIANVAKAMSQLI